MDWGYPASYNEPMQMKALVKAVLVSRGWTQADLAARLDTTQVTVSRWLAGAEPRGAMRDKLRALAEETGQLEGERREHTLPIMGFVGAGAAIDPDFEQVPPEGLQQVELPYPMAENLIGFQVRGDSMMPKYDPGEILVVAREQPMSIDSMLGDVAVVRTYDGRRLIKRIMPGPKPHTYNLESANAETMIGVRLEWASPVRMAIPNVGLRHITPKPARKGAPQKGVRPTSKKDHFGQ